MAELRALTVQSGTDKKQVVRKSDMSKPRRTATTPAEKKKTQGNMARCEQCVLLTFLPFRL